VRKEIFICENCGLRQRLDSSQRHWCEQCTHIAPVEMSPARLKKMQATPPQETPAAAR